MAEMFQIKITKKGKNPEQWFKEVSKSIYPEMQNQLLLSAESTAIIMREILMSSGYDLRALADTIGVDILNTTAGIHLGIGNINNFPVGKESGYDYWELFESGFKVTTPNIGYFGDNFRAPESGGFGEKWHHTGRGSGFYYMKPDKVISPLNYVYTGYEKLKTHIEKEINKFSKNIEKASRGGYGYSIGGAR